MELIGPDEDAAPPRLPTGALDLGAYEFPGNLFADGFESQDTSRWSETEP